MKINAVILLNFVLCLSLLLMSSAQTIQHSVDRRLGDTTVVHHPPPKPTTSGSSSGGGGGSSSSSGGGSSGHTVTSNSKAPVSKPKPHLIALGMAAAAVAAGAVVAVAASRRQTETEPSHSLKGSISRRMTLFNHMAELHEDAARPPRREVQAIAATDYSLAPHGAGFVSV